MQTEAGAYLFNSAALFSRCTFMNNQAGRFGGGVYSKSSQAKFTGCAFSFNRAEGKDGGGIYQDNCTSEIINCIFSNNTASRWGGALGLYNSPSIIVNNDFIYNLASQGSGALNKYGSGPAVIRNCIFLKNGITYYKEGPQVAPMEPPIPEIIMTNSLMHDDPLFFSFVDPNDPNGPDNTFGTADDGLRLSCSSPAINKGDNSAVSSITTDITGNSRIQYSTVDMGAYESFFYYTIYRFCFFKCVS
ncbi:MAG: right-handed parallel beta-helix repeat-containing protein [Bacteroidota bacterium]